MILLDANLLIYAHVRSFTRHERARGWLDTQLSGSTRVGLPWPSLIAFLRVVTNPRVLERPVPAREAWQQVREWLSVPVVWIPCAGEQHVDTLERLLAGAGIRAGLVHDAHLAALALEHGLVLCSTDGDFARFDGLRWQNPLA